jgi:Domain of unknown function (DUF4394)
MLHLLTRLTPFVAASALAACAWMPQILPGHTAPALPPGGNPDLKETVLAVTADHSLIRFAAAQPSQVLQRKAITGLPPGEKILSIDFRVARGVLYALSSPGRLYTLDPQTAALTPVGPNPIGWPLLGAHVGFDFNPVADRIRIVTEAAQNLRAHPDTGVIVDFDDKAPGVQADLALGYVNGDAHAGDAPCIGASAYTYNKQNDKLTTNYVIDLCLGLLVMQGSHESKAPPVSPNSGRLMTVGLLGTGKLVDAAFDISDLGNTPLAALRTDATRLYQVDLKTGAATLVGPVADGGPLRGMAIEP